MWGKKKQRPELLRREPKRFWYALSAGVCAAILVVAIRGELGMYIHPRYALFTIVMLAIALVALTVAAVQYRYRRQTHIEYKNAGELILLFCRWLFGRGAWVPIVVIALLLFVPPKPLLSAAAERKNMTEFELEYIVSTPWFHTPTSIYQLSSVLQIDSGRQAQIGQSYTLSGFVRKDANPDIMLLSRFVMACCAVDARPVTVAIYAPGWQQTYSQDEWIEVAGTVEMIHDGAGLRPMLRPHAVRSITRPSDPYDYL